MCRPDIERLIRYAAEMMNGREFIKSNLSCLLSSRSVRVIKSLVGGLCVFAGADVLAAEKLPASV